MHPDWNRISSVFASHGIAVTPSALASVEFSVMRSLDAGEWIRASTDGERVGQFFERVLRAATGSAFHGSLQSALAELLRLHAAENLWEAVFEDVVPALERLRRLGLDIVVLSNANGTVRQRLARAGLLGWFSHVVDSGEEGVEKPDPRFFSLSLERAGADPTTTLHVGDLFEVDVVGARRAGIEAVLIDRAGLQQDRDCPRYHDLIEVAEALERRANATPPVP